MIPTLSKVLTCNDAILSDNQDKMLNMSIDGMSSKKSPSIRSTAHDEQNRSGGLVQVFVPNGGRYSIRRDVEGGLEHSNGPWVVCRKSTTLQMT